MASPRSEGITPFLVMEILERAAEMERSGKEIVHLEAGEPDFDTPPVIKEAAQRALVEGKTHYTHSQGLMELREAIAEQYWQRYHARVTPDCILITAGSSPGMQLAFAMLLEEGDEVILSDPGYACYSNMIRFQGGMPRTVEISEEDGFQYHPDAIAQKICSRTKGILINSPANPTGMILSPGKMRELAELGSLIFSDEIYHGLTYDEEAHSVLEFTDHALVFSGFSKLYAMTGWRLGYVIVPRPLARTLQTLHQNFFISANAFVQWAGVAALNHAAGDVASMVVLYDKRRRFMVEGLRRLGFQIRQEPQGAFYVFVNAKWLSGDSLKLCIDILEKARVAVAPGVDFGANGEGYLRFSYANSLANIEEGLRRLQRYIQTVRG